MSISFKTLPAHFDGHQIHLDESYPLQQNAKLLVIVLPEQSQEDERSDWAHISLNALGNAYDEHEPAYSLNSLKEKNPDYEGK